MKKTLIISFALLLCLNVYAQPSQEDIQRYSAYYSNGMDCFKNGQFSSAISEFKKVLRFSPYDTTVQNALANAYLARAQYFRSTTKEIKKALVDYKNAYFYAKYWSKDDSNASLNQLANTASKEIASLESRLGIQNNQNIHLQSAKTLKAQGELAAAGYEFHKILNGQNASVAYENLSNIYKNLNNTMLGLEYIQNAVNLDPKNAKLHFLYGVMLDEAQNYEASMEQYNLALQYGDKSPELMEILENKWTQNIVNNPNNAQNYVNLGAIYQKQGNFEGAKNQYLKAIAMNPNDDTASYNLASLYIQQKNYQGAINVYNNLLMKKPNNLEIMNYKAEALYESNRFDEALSQYEAILKLNPEDKNAQSIVDDIVYNKFDKAKLQNYLVNKANINPKNYDAQFNVAFEFHKNKNYPMALQYYQKALNADPSKEEIYINIAQIYLEEKQFEKAGEICQKGLLILPNSSQLNKYLEDSKNLAMGTLFDEATKLYEAKQFESAINKYSQIQNKTSEVKMAIASCYWELSDYKNANAFYQEVLAENPNNKDALINSAYAYFSLNDYTSAKTVARKILTIDKTNKEALDILNNIESQETGTLLQDAITKYEKGEYQNSINLIDKYLKIKPYDEYALYYKGLSYDELKKPDEAIKQYKLIISKNPNFENAYYSLAVDLDNQEKYSEAVKNYDKFLSLKNGAKDDMTKFAADRSKELKDYLGKVGSQ